MPTPYTFLHVVPPGVQQRDALREVAHLLIDNAPDDEVHLVINTLRSFDDARSQARIIERRLAGVHAVQSSKKRRR